MLTLIAPFVKTEMVTGEPARVPFATAPRTS